MTENMIQDRRIHQKEQRLNQNQDLSADLLPDRGHGSGFLHLSCLACELPNSWTSHQLRGELKVQSAWSGT